MNRHKSALACWRVALDKSWPVETEMLAAASQQLACCYPSPFPRGGRSVPHVRNMSVRSPYEGRNRSARRTGITSIWAQRLAENRAECHTRLHAFPCSGAAAAFPNMRSGGASPESRLQSAAQHNHHHLAPLIEYSWALRGLTISYCTGHTSCPCHRSRL